tara:strand:+ start:7986 stop:8807 length:822 start_codon:yes stop_codon:yes gene_type:complete
LSKIKEVAEAVVKDIDEAYEKDKREKSRRYIGASIIGNPCDAMIAFNLRGFPNDEPSARLKRIFKLGHILEDEVVKDLKKSGTYQVYEVDGLTGKQHTYTEMGGHVVCHTDGLIEVDENVSILEIKSMNDASWSKFKKSGVKVSHPSYYGQCQMMMGLSSVPTTLFIAVNKNNSEYHAEIVEADVFEFSFIKERIERAISGNVTKISVDETDWRCRGCFKRSVCWEKVTPQPDCTFCVFAEATKNGEWHCHKHDTRARKVCSEYEQFKPQDKE